MRQHIEEAAQTLFELAGRQLKEEVGVSFPSRGVQLPTASLNEGHQALYRGVVATAEEKQMFKKMGQPGVYPRGIMSAAMYPHQSRSLRAVRQWQQAHAQAVSQGYLWRTLGKIGRGMHWAACFRLWDSEHRAEPGSPQ